MANLLKITVLGVLLATGWITVAGEAQAMAISRCVRIVPNRQVDRETLVNTCTQCVVAKVERRRPGTATGVPSMREFTLMPGSSLPLPFMGPGQSRITAELPCGGAQGQPQGQ